MESGLLSVSKLFTERLFRIPDYQRGYSWRIKQLKEFWMDIEQLDRGESHYLGVLTLELVPEKQWSRWSDDTWIIEVKNFIPYHVVDGQQRLTTIVILIQCILEAIRAHAKLNYSSKDEIQSKYIYLQKEGPEGSFLFGYERDNPSYEHLKTRILQKASARYSAGESTIYTKNLSAAKEFLSKKVAELKPDDLQAVFSKVTQNLLLNVFHIEKEVDVHVAFETMNNRGLQLSNLELLKNRLIYLTTRLGEPQTNIESLRRTINDCWKTVYYYLGKNPGASLSDDYFLQIHFLIYFAKDILEEHQGLLDHALSSVQQIYRDYLLDNKFSVKRLGAKASDRLTSSFLYHYSMDLKRSVESYYELSFPEESQYGEEEKLWLARLKRLLSVSDRKEIFVLLLLLLPKLQKKDDRLRMLKVIEGYFFITGLLSYRYRKKFNTFGVGIELLRCAGQAGDVVKLSEKLEAQVKEFSSDPSVSEGVLEGLADAGYYEWRDLKYFMYEYECHLKLRSRKKSDKIEWQTFLQDGDEDHASIEHVLPQTPSDSSWKQQLAGLKPNEVKRVTNSLGNLVALSKARNSSLRNLPFNEKCGSKEKRTGYKFGSYSEIEISLNDSWGPSEILSRGILLLNFMEERWGVKFRSEDHKRKCLGLDFMKSIAV